MDKFGLIGWPVDHSGSPRLFEAAYGGRYRYDLLGDPSFEVCRRNFLDRGYRAVNVTAPFKEVAAARADVRSAVVERIGAANILVNDGGKIKAFNSDYLGVRTILRRCGRGGGKVVVIGFGGAGKAALAAARDEGFTTELRRHDEIAGGLDSDIVIYTLPRFVEGADRIRCSALIEANYRDPSLKGIRGAGEYIPGEVWLVEQAVSGFLLMTGEKPDIDSLRSSIL